MSKKILALLLSLAMLGSAANLPVFAENDEAETMEVMETVGTEATESADLLSYEVILNDTSNDEATEEIIAENMDYIMDSIKSYIDVIDSSWL